MTKEQGMTREEAQHVAQATFGPKAECVRVSSSDRNSRCVVALGSYRLSRTERPVPLLLGSGPDWSSAIDHARGTPNGLKAIEEMQKVKDFINKAMESAKPGDFADFVRDQTIEEAKMKGATQEVIDAIRKKFDEAKKKIIEKPNDDNPN